MPEAFRYQKGKDCLVSESVKRGHSSGTVPAMAFVLVRLSEGEAHSGSQLPGHWPEDPCLGHPFPPPASTLLAEVGTEKFEE